MKPRGDAVVGNHPLGPLVTLGALLGVVVGCGPLVGVHPPPEPVSPDPAASSPSPTHRIRERAEDPPPPPPDAAEAPVSPEEVPDPTPFDPILDAPFTQTPEMAARIEEWIQSFQNREEPLFRASLEKMGRYRAMVDQELQEEGLPASLISLPIVESWYNPRAVSWVGAAGLWQFMPPTARGMGMQVDGLVDERRDPYRSTPLALAYLSGLHDRLGSWVLALAAYNGGPGRVERLLRRRAPGVEGADSLFLHILSDLPRETRNFVPRFLAAARIARDPEAYGFSNIQTEGAWEFDEVEVPDATSLDVVARAGRVDQAVVEELNPKLLRGLTPAGVRTRLRLPRGVGRQFEEAYALIPPEERVTFVDHAVVQGETLTHIARRYGVPVDDIRAANPRIEPRRMQIGQRVIVPKAPSARESLRRDGEGVSEVRRERVVLYRVQSGDTLTGIAQRHRVGLGDILRWNDLSRTSVIHPGDEVRIYLPGG